MRRVSVAVIMLAVALLAPAGASAGGFEYTAAGTRPLGRGGAFFARADDPMALLYNPAMLADLPDTQVQLQSHLAFLDLCAQRPGRYIDVLPGGTGQPTVFDTMPDGDPTAEPWLNSQMPRVCRSGYPGPSPDVVASIRILPELALAFGILAPSAIGSGAYGDERATVQSAGGLAPSPLRYALAQQDLLLFFPSIGFGWRIHEMVRIGFTFQWGIADLDFVNFSTSNSMGVEDPFDDVRTNLQVSDWFVPAGILSVHVQPHPNFDISLTGRISDAIGGVSDASGRLNLTSRYFSALPESPAETTTVEGIRLRAGQPWQFALGLRYADRIRPRAWERGFEAAVRGVVDDPMYSENFDIELDVVYEMNSQVGQYQVELPPGAAVSVDGVAVGLPTTQIISKGWRDTLVLRLGGDYNVIPGMLALRAGFHTELPVGQSPYQVHDNIQGYRFGLHAGGTFRIERFDISIAYAHIFQLDMAITEGQFTQSSAACMGSCMPSVVNNGTYTAEWNVLSLAVGYHFE